MTVLVTGGAGYIGGHMALGLADAGRERSSSRQSLDRLRLGRAGDGATLVVGDFGRRGLDRAAD